MTKIPSEPQLVLENGLLSGNIKNCFIRLDTVPETAVLEIFFPKSADEDRWGLRDILNEPYIIKREWIDSGLRLFLKGIPPKDLLDYCKPLISKITSYFSGKYPLEVFRRYKHYTSGKMSRVILLHINEIIVLKYCEELRADFTKNYFKVIFTEKGSLQKVFINCYEEGTLEYKNNSIEMHRWENEDEAQSVSYLSKHYTQRLLDGVINVPDTKTKMIGIIKTSMKSAAIENDDRRFFDSALNFLETKSNERHT